MIIDKEKTLSILNNTFDKFIDYINNDIEHVSLEDFDKKETVLVIIDMVNGFVRTGVLSSPFVDKISAPLAELAKKCEALSIPIIAYADTHTNDSAEFKVFPVHCLQNSYESDLIDELKNTKSIIRVDKNSTNSFLAKNPLDIVKAPIKNILVTGCVTDICVRDFAKTMKKYLDENNLNVNIYLAENLVDTYDIPNVHDRQTEHLLAVYDMKNSGINIINLR